MCVKLPSDISEMTNVYLNPNWTRETNYSVQKNIQQKNHFAFVSLSINVNLFICLVKDY